MPVQITGARGRLCCICFCISREYHVLIVQINHFKPTPRHSASDGQSFRFGAKIFNQSGRAGGPNPISAALIITLYQP